MSILDRLSSRCGERSEESNQNVAADCIENPGLLREIIAGLGSRDAKLAGDCAEVCTMAAMVRPDLIAPYAEDLAAVRLHPATRVRWEAAHSLALVAALRPEMAAGLLQSLVETIRSDTSIIVRDYSIDILANFAAVGEAEAKRVYPALVESLNLWNGRHAGHALAGLEYAARFLPALRSEIRSMIQPFLSNDRQVIRKAAAQVNKAAER